MTPRTGRPLPPLYRGARPDAGTVATAAALLVVAIAAWVALLAPVVGGGAMDPMRMEAGEMDGQRAGSSTLVADGPAISDAFGAVVFVGAWLVMMTAMMLPSAAPMILLHRRMTTGTPARRAAQTAAFVSGYLVTWAVFGLVVYVGQRGLAVVSQTLPAVEGRWPFIVAGVVLAAGLYQFSPLKERCLRQCRSPFSFLMVRWRPGLAGGLSLGVRHGAYCVGCCWALMAVLVAAGAMGLAWVSLIAALVFVEKLLPAGTVTARLVGTMLVGVAIAIVARPQIVDSLAR